jgi:formylglycine-generating enzyme required for sulfatase activity
MNRELAAYLSRVISETEYLTFGNPQGVNTERLRLEDVWIPPTVSVAGLGNSPKFASPWERRSVSERSVLQVDAALNMSMFKKTVITAPPGYGKSTLCRRLAHLYAYEANVHGTGWIPVRVSLAAVNQDGAWSSIEELLHRLPNVTSPELVSVLATASVRGHLWFFLDGLDEVAPSQLQRLRSQLDATVLATRNRILATCRTADYVAERPKRSLGTLPVLEIAGFTDDELDIYVEHWYSSASSGRPGVTRQRMAATRERLDAHGELRELARSPLLAAVLCVVEAQPLRTQPGKAALLKRAVEYLLLDPQWRDTDGRRADPIVDADEAKRLGSRLAFETLDDLGEAARQGLTWEELRQYVREALQSDGSVLGDEEFGQLADAYVAQLVGRNAAGLLQQREAHTYAFAHKSLQEYLAAQHLIKYVDRSYRAELALQPAWKEVFGYVASIAQMTGEGLTDMLLLSRSLLRRAERSLTMLIDSDRPATTTEGACLVGEMLAEVGAAALRRYGFAAAVDGKAAADQDDPGFSGLWSLAVDVLFAVVSNLNAPSAARMRALCAVSRLGDPRFVDEHGRLRSDSLSLLVVPGGRGRIGTPTPLAVRGRKQVLSSPQVDVRTAAFEMARFPVMNIEYAEFVADGGYTNPEWWVSETAARWRAQDPVFLDELIRLWESQKDLHFEKEFGEREFATYAKDQSERIARRTMQRSVPLYWRDSRFNLPTAPVVGVNYWEAQAYCRWLANRLKRQGRLGAADAVSLPTEVEWEWAASTCHTGRRNAFPWGDSFDASKCIVRDFSDTRAEPGIVHFGAVPVGFFALGKDALTLEDLGGNVWEWVSSRSLPWDSGDDRESADGLDNRVCRGGSWYSSEPLASHVSFRSDDPPCNAYWDLGFRIVVRRDQESTDRLRPATR